jgi:hypothetical protein
MVEMMLDAQPAHAGLLMTACSGFTQYSYAFLHVDSELTAAADPRAAAALRERAGRMYARARGYCLRALGIRHRGLADALSRDARSALPLLADTAAADVPALFWTAAAAAGELAVADNQLERMGELALVRALFERVLTLDEDWENGAVHEAMIAVEGLPALLGGSPQRARAHFTRAVALSDGHSAFPYVTLASSVALPARNRKEFERLLQQALAVDSDRRPELRLANAIAGKRARFLLSSADRLFK